MNIPTFLTINDFYKLSEIKSITNVEDIVDAVSLILDVPKDDLLELPKTELQQTINQVLALFSNISPKFWGVFELDGVEYGFQPLSKMTMSEWIDLDTLCKDYRNNLHKLMAILYRPIVKRHYKNPIWKAKYHIRLLQNKSTNAFEMYEVEKYKSGNVELEEIMKGLPIEIAQGAMSFFLVLATKFTNHSQISLGKMTEEEAMTNEKEIVKLLYQPTMDGFM